MSLKPPNTPSPPAVDVAAEDQAALLSQWQLTKRKFAQHRLAVWSVRMLVLLYGVALFAEVIAPQSPNSRDLDFQYCPPQLVGFDFQNGLHTTALQQHVDPITLRRVYVELDEQAVPLGLFAKGEPYRLWGLIPLDRHLIGIDHDELEREASNTSEASFYLLGADRYGRDLFSRIVYGARVSLSVGLVGIAVTFVLGMVIGGISGYVGGRTDNFIQRAIEVISSFPQLPLWIALGAIMPGDWSAIRVYFAITIVLALLNWTGLARVVRGKILSLREEDYAVAARLLGASHGRILFRHLLPGFTSHVIVAVSLSVPGMILGETSLSFLGLGLRPPVVSWGVLLQDCMDVQAVRYYPWLLTPVIFIILTVLSFNFVGDGLRDAADPYASHG
ncbi:MAG: ABC transporter permease [Planctomycetota bacterium]